MGFDPNRPFHAKRFDYVLVGLALAACVALLAWALLG